MGPMDMRVELRLVSGQVRDRVLVYVGVDVDVYAHVENCKQSLEDLCLFLGKRSTSMVLFSAGVFGVFDGVEGGRKVSIDIDSSHPLISAWGFDVLIFSDIFVSLSVLMVAIDVDEGEDQ